MCVVERLTVILFISWLFLSLFNIGRSMLVGQRPMKSLSYVCASVRLSVRPRARPSLSFLKIGSLVFPIVHDDGWPWYLVTDEARILKKKGQNRVRN